MVDLPGTRIGRYQIVETLGSGGFSTVYRAIDEQLDAYVALKVLAENHALDADVRERFFGEAQLLRRIQSPSVIAVHDVGETDRRQPYIVMGLAQGGDLGSRVDQLDQRGATPGLASGSDLTQARYSVTAHDVLTVTQALAASLGAAHDVGIVHRDVKPSNLLIVNDNPTSVNTDSPRRALLSAGERLVLSDLGLAKDVGANSGLTVGAGTAGFAAPEQLVPTTRITRSVDIHAATAVVFWLLTRELPTSDSAWTRIPGPVKPVLRRGLAARPEDRFDTMAEWYDAIRDALETGSNALTGRSAPLGRTRVLLVVTGLLLALVAAGAAGYVVSARDGTTTETVSDGTRQVRATRSGVELTVTGPAAAAVGEEVVLEATTTSGSEIVWVVPTGQSTTGDSLRLTTRRSGTAVITVVTGIESEGAVVTEFELEVR